MGFFSYECKECGHSVLSSYSTDPEINAWMKDVVVLSSNGSRAIGEYDGYGNVGGMDSEGMGGDVWVHLACWEKAGEPGYDHYDGSSPHAEDQGYFFRYEHDMIDPRITDEAERARLLEEGKAAREQRWYDGRATDVYEWLHEDPKWKDKEDLENPWKQRFSYFETCVEDENGELIEKDGRGYKDGTHWYVQDKLNPDATEEERRFRGTEEELMAHLAATWAAFLESEECRAYITRAKELREEARQRKLADLKEEGRYEPSYRSVPLDGGKYQTMWYVKDKMHYQKVGPELPGTWGRDEVKKDVKRLEAEWAAAGYPWEEYEEGD